MTGVLTFLENPLVTWVKTFSASKDEVDFQEVADAVYLTDVLTNIVERDVEKIQRQAKDRSARLQNWALLVHTIQTYYMDILQQVVVMKTPDVFTILESPSKDGSLCELEHVLLLLLGCAVQCERKEHYINTIKSLDVNCQKALVDCIKQITDNPDNVVALDTYGDSDDAKQLYFVVKKVVTERNSLFQLAVTLKQERDYYENEVSRKKGELTAPPSLEKYQLLRDLQEYKAKVQQATLDIEDKGKTICEMKEELQRKQQELNKVKAGSLRLENDAKFARSYRDELDNLREQALKAGKLEKEVAKYKEKVHEMEYFKARVEELREDNNLLCECKDKLEDQVGSVQGRLNTVMHDLSQSQVTLQQTQQEKSDLEKRLSEAMEENALLDFEKNRMKDGYTGPLRRMISYTSSEFLHGGSQLQLAMAGHPISDELNDSMTSHVTRLEVENDQLKNELEEIKTKLYSTQQEVEKLLNQSEKDYKKRLLDNEKDHRKRYQNIRREISDELTKRYESQLSELQTALDEKSDVLKKYQHRVGDTEKDRLHLAEQVRGLEDMLRSARRERDEFNAKVEKAKLELQVCHSKLRISQDSKESFNLLQGEKEDLIRELSCQKEQIQQDKVLVKKVQRENEDLLQKLKNQQEFWKRDKDKFIRLQQEKAAIASERDELRNNIESVRECSDQHIKQLEEQLFTLQDKSVAMENLNDYLNNLSVLDNSVDPQHSQHPPDMYDTDLDAHLSLPSSSNNSFCSVSSNVDKNHNDKIIRHKSSSGRHKREAYSEVFYDSDNSSKDYRSGRQHSASLDNGDSSYLMDDIEQPARIAYVKRNTSSNQSAALQEQDKSGSQRFLSKLKSYVKSPKPDVKSNDRSSRSSDRPPLQEVQLRRDNNAFVRNSKHRSTIHGHPLMESSPLVKHEKFHSPVVEAKSRPVSSSFSRSNPLRQTMPEKKTTYVFPDKRNSSHNSSTSHHSSTSRESVQSHRRSHNYPSSSTSYDNRRDYSSDMDSGLDVFNESSPAINNTSRQQEENVDSHHQVTSIQIMSTETVESYRKLSNGKSAEKLRAMAERLMQLQNKNQALSSDNSKLKKLLESLSGPGSLGSLEKRTHELEAENRKLRLIVETLQNTLSGRNPYDDKEYHYFTNV